ncbi:MAG: hypothetical protein HY791_02300 [Deltaproteobacteria bacterium]|nr:hypothetical protein [Deltaproteobacteria bacterium]
MSTPLALRPFVAETRRAFLPSVFAEAPGQIGIESHLGRRWLELESGQELVTDPKRGWPENAQHVARARGPGLIGHTAPTPVSTERWAAEIAGTTRQAESAGSTVLAQVVRGPNEVRSIWWLGELGATLVRDRLAPEVRVELLADGWALLLDPTAGRLEVLGREREQAALLPLPTWLLEDLRKRDLLGAHRVMTVSHGRSILAIAGHRKVTWWSVGQLIDAARGGEGTVDWAPRRVIPIQLDEPALPEISSETVSLSFEIVATPEIVVSAAIRKAVDALKLEGKLGEMNEQLLEALVEGRSELLISTLLRSYYEAGSHRAGLDGYVAFGPSTDAATLQRLVGDWLPATGQLSSASEVIAACNRKFRETGDARRFVGIDMASDDEAFLLVEGAAARRLDAAGIPVFGL